MENMIHPDNLLGMLQPRVDALRNEFQSIDSQNREIGAQVKEKRTLVNCILHAAYQSIEEDFAQKCARARGLPPGLELHSLSLESILEPPSAQGRVPISFGFSIGMAVFCGTVGATPLDSILELVIASGRRQIRLYTEGTFKEIFDQMTGWNAARCIYLALDAIQRLANVSLLGVCMLPWLLHHDTQDVLQMAVPPVMPDPFRHFVVCVPHLSIHGPGYCRLVSDDEINGVAGRYRLAMPAGDQWTTTIPEAATLAADDVAFMAIINMLRPDVLWPMLKMPEIVNGCHVVLDVSDYGTIQPPSTGSHITRNSMGLARALQERSMLLATETIVGNQHRHLRLALDRSSHLLNRIMLSLDVTRQWNAQGQPSIAWPYGLTWLQVATSEMLQRHIHACMRTPTLPARYDVQMAWCTPNGDEIARLEVGRVASKRWDSDKVSVGARNMDAHTVILSVRGAQFRVARFDPVSFGAIGEALGGLSAWQVAESIHALLLMCYDQAGLAFKPTEIVRYPCFLFQPPPNIILAADLRIHTGSWPGLQPVDPVEQDTYMFRKNVPVMMAIVTKYELRDGGRSVKIIMKIPEGSMVFSEAMPPPSIILVDDASGLSMQTTSLAFKYGQCVATLDAPAGFSFQ